MFYILNFVAALAAEAELVALFKNTKEAKVMKLTLREIVHSQPLTPIHCGNATETGIANRTVKIQRSRSMKMRYFYICDVVKKEEVQLDWQQGQNNLGDYVSKRHDTKQHQQVRPIYLHEANLPRMFPRAINPSVLRGCVGTIPVGYVRGRPLNMYVVTTTHVPRIRTQVAPAT